MNSDEIKSLIIKVLLLTLAPLATKYGIDGSTTTAIVTWVATGLVLAYGIYDHWNEKKVPENAVAVVLPPRVVVPPVGQSINLSPVTGIAKVVG